jgi:hypothetical protein
MKELEEDLPPILDIRDICSILRVSDTSVRRELTRQGGIPGYLAEGKWNVARADFLAYLERNGTL